MGVKEQLRMLKKARTLKQSITRNGRILGAYVPFPLLDAIQRWISLDPERDQSMFVRAATREKLARDGIRVEETRMADSGKPST